ncbi:putative TetR family transcriptional regulator [Gordonia araii NBRC 100433]|uniref:Putative TetR family transcriptional regulator n=1 Tax=Gordonia araii NBRC 100433 TaxID=1073574 RepID=G7H527_9ACTN|nr:TetR/AcrR family transcriptional regulator [Gordonia araii]NNG96642.1 TetR/AcrR family transcriptional regulator [Gordonia araii NBRC 100433]GAB10952.1 putative TetR family transcriptional regulator [Gordonia araii NBRC 100433]
MDDQRPVRPPVLSRRRAETRERLLDAAMTVFVAKGFGRTRIDDVCRAAGYTKGAFYSNFSTLEELFFALYDRQSEYAATTTLAAVTPGAAVGDSAAESAPDIVDVISSWAATVRIDRDWLLINTDFVSYAARYPDVAAELAEHRRQLREEVVDALTTFIAATDVALPGSLPTPAQLARAVVTVYDGVIYQLLLDMDEGEVRRHFVAILTALVDR